MNGFRKLFFTVALLLSVCVSESPAAGLFQHPVDPEDPGSGFTAVVNKLQGVKVLRCRFVQQKRIKILRKPLISEGIMLFSAEKGLYWEIRSPVSSIIIATKQGIFEKTGNTGHRVMGGGKTAGAAKSAKLFTAVFSGDIKTMIGHFELYFLEKSDLWSIGLKPRTGMLKKIFSRITVRGAGHIEEILLDEHGGDTTVLRFSDIKTHPAKLTLRERGYFDF